MNANERRKMHREVEKINRRLETIWLPTIRQALRYTVNNVIAALRKGGQSEATRWMATNVVNPKIGETIRGLYRQVGLRHARRMNVILNDEPQQLKRLGKNDEWVSFIQDYLEKNLFTKITLKMNETTKKALLLAIQTGIDKGLGIDDIVRSLQDWPFLYFQAARIVRTEVNRAANVGIMASASTFKFEQVKEWISAEDNRVRGTKPEDHASHVRLDGRVVEENEYWIDPRNGDVLRFPGDPEASAASVINCRCTMGITAKRDANGRLIPKKTTTRISVILPGQFVRRPQMQLI